MLPRALSFLKETNLSRGIREFSGYDMVFDLIEEPEQLQHVPQTAGVYIIVATDGTTFQYPKGKSPVMYIGMSTNLQSRLMQHANAVKSVTENLDFSCMTCQCHQRYHYFRVFGAKVYVFTAWLLNTNRNLVSLTIHDVSCKL